MNCIGMEASTYLRAHDLVSKLRTWLHSLKAYYESALSTSLFSFRAYFKAISPSTCLPIRASKGIVRIQVIGKYCVMHI